MKRRVQLGAVALAVWILGAPVGKALAANAGAGAEVFEEECAECHTVSGKHKKGPSLKGILGRKAGSAPGFTGYSDPVKNSNMVWTAEAMDRYLTKPKNFSPYVNMKYKGLADPQARADLIEFLGTRK